MERALEAIKSQPNIDFELDIDFGLNNEILDDKPGDNKIFNDIDFGLDDEILDGKSIDLNHPINAKTEGIWLLKQPISVQA